MMMMSNPEEYTLPLDYSNTKITDGDDSGCGSSVCSNGSAIVNSANNSGVISTNGSSNATCGDTSDTNSDAKDSDNTNGKKRHPKCARCQNHDKLVAVKGHKRKCEYKDCICKLCILTIDRRDLMAKTIAAKRRLQEDKADNCYIPPDYVPEKKLKRITADDADNGVINGTKEQQQQQQRYNNNQSPNLKQDVSQISLSAVRVCFKKIIDHINEQFGSRLPTDWIESLYEREFLLGVELAKSPVKDQLALEVDKILRDAIIPVLKEFRPKKPELEEEYNNTPKKLSLESSHHISAFQKVVAVNNNNNNSHNHSQPEYPQSLMAKENVVHLVDAKPKSLDSLHLYANGGDGSHHHQQHHHHSQLPLVQNCIPRPSIYHYHNGMSSGHVIAPTTVAQYQPFVVSSPIAGYTVDSPFAPLPKPANILHTVHSMISSNNAANNAKHSIANGVESKINCNSSSSGGNNSNTTNTNNSCAKSKYSACNGISSTPKKQILAHYMKVSK